MSNAGARSARSYRGCRFFLMQKREFHLGSHYEHLPTGARVLLTGHGKSVIVVRRHRAAEVLCKPTDLGKELASSQVIDIASSMSGGSASLGDNRIGTE